MLAPSNQPPISKPNATAICTSLRVARARSSCLQPYNLAARPAESFTTTAAAAAANNLPGEALHSVAAASLSLISTTSTRNVTDVEQTSTHLQQHGSTQDPPPALAARNAAIAAAAKKVLKPSAVRRCRNTQTLCNMLYLNRCSVNPQFWVTALVHLTHLVACEGQQIPAASWKKLKECLNYLVGEQQQQQQSIHAIAAGPVAPVAEQCQQGQQQWVHANTAAEAAAEQHAKEPQQHRHLTKPETDAQQSLQRNAQQQHQQLAAEHILLDPWQPSNFALPHHHHQQQQQPRPGPTAAAPVTTMQHPLVQFAASDTVTLIWALARLKVQLPAASANTFWPIVLQQISHSSSSSSSGDRGQLTPRDMALLAWSLLQLRVPVPAGWFQGLLEVQVPFLAGYPTKSLVILLHAAARLGLTIPPSSSAAMLSALQPRLRLMSVRDLSQLMWSLGALQLRPSGEFMAAAMAASKRQLSGASCPELTSILSGVARLSYLPPGPWLLEIFDQLYWTADQLQLQQLTSIVWAFGKLRLVAVPQELLERLLTFTLMQMRPQLTAAAAPAAAAAAEAQDGLSSSSSSTSEVAKSAMNPSSSSSSIEQYVLAKQVCTLMVGLAGLRRQLPAETAIQSNIGPAWIRAVLAGDGLMSHVHVPACLHAAALLNIRLSSCQDSVQADTGSQASRTQLARQDGVRTVSGPQPGTAAGLTQSAPQDNIRTAPGPQTGKSASASNGSSQLCQAVLDRLSGLRPRLSHTGLALAFWGAGGLGCRPNTSWVVGWLAEAQKLMSIATAGEINMLLHGCVAIRYVPEQQWLRAAYDRLGQLLFLSKQAQQGGSSSSTAALSGSSMVATLKYLLALQKLHHTQQLQGASAALQQGQQQQPQGAILARQQEPWSPVPPQLLAQLSERMEYLERHRSASPHAVKMFQRFNEQILQSTTPQHMQRLANGCSSATSAGSS